jgi:hypothetical protein
MTANAGSFQDRFRWYTNARNPIDQFETNRVGNLVVNAKISGYDEFKNRS